MTNTCSAATDQELLGQLAFQFRGTASGPVRDDIVRDYANAVRRLVNGGGWDELPPPEDLLPDNLLPTEFFNHWFQGQGKP